MTRRPKHSRAAYRAGLVVGIGIVMATATSALAQNIDPPDLWEPVFLPTLEALSDGDAAWGDYDGDGDFDLFYTGNMGTYDNPQPFAQLYFNEGETTVTIPDPSNPDGVVEAPATNYVDAVNINQGNIFDIWRSAVAWGDYDNDGRLDVLATGIRENGVRETWIYRNIGDGLFLDGLFLYPGVSDGDVAWGDYDNDGDLDFAISGLTDAGDAVTLLYENRISEGGDFVARDAGIEGLYQSEIAWGDYDNDMDLDLLVTGVAEPQRFVTAIYRNEGAGVFTDAGAGLEGLYAASVAFGDGDADGDLDVLVSGAELNPFLLEGKAIVYENVGGNFSTSRFDLQGRFQGDPALGRYAGSAAWGDFDNDGVIDFIIDGLRRPLDTETGQTYQSMGGQTYVKSTIGFGRGFFSGGANGASFFGDYDNDGDLDLFVMGRTPSGQDMVMSLRNFLPFYPRNSAPSPPGFLESTVSADRVELSWAPGHDGFNNAESLSYNVRIGTGPGLGNIMAPMAHAANGRRFLSAYGNAQQNLGWVIRNLAPGTYYWTVQTIDTSFRGSQFSVESTFTIAAQ